MNIVLEIHKLITALPKFEIENALKAGTSSHIASIPHKVEAAFTISGPKLPH